MVSGGSVDGLVSGMSTSQVISQLMQVEAAPQTALKTKVNNQQKVVGAYQSINSKMSALLTAAKSLTDTTTWKAATATSTSDAVVAAASGSGTAQTGSLTFRVSQLAAAHSIVYGADTGSGPVTVANTSDPVMTGSSLSLQFGGNPPVAINVTNKSLKGVVDAINGANAGVKATAVQVRPGEYTLQVTANTTGESSRFTLSGIDQNLLGGSSDVTIGNNAKLTIGTDNTYDVESATNTFTDLMGGLTVTATKKQALTDPPVTVTVAPDAQGLAGKVQALVDAANGALSEIASQSRTKSELLSAGPLAGNSSMQQLSGQILSTVSAGAGALGSLKAVGVELTRDGKLKFNKETFLNAYAADPAKTQSYFASSVDANNDGVKDGVADRLSALADKTTKSNTGTLSALISSGNNTVRDLNKRIDEWDVRLETRRTSLQRQFTAMETALSKLQSQSSWLSGQISSLG